MRRVGSGDAPEVAVQKAPVPHAALAEREALAGEEVIGRREAAGGQARDDAKEKVERLDDDARPQEPRTNSYRSDQSGFSGGNSGRGNY